MIVPRGEKYYRQKRLIEDAVTVNRARTPKAPNALETENIGLREMLAQAGLDAARLLAQSGANASENETAKQLQRLLLEELHHRVKNTLATVIAITSQSLRNAENLEQGRYAVESRLMALSRAHDLLLQTNWNGAKIGDVIRATIEPFDDRRASRFVVQGAATNVGASSVLPLTMFLNELCTNAVKYGALSADAGRITISSTADAASQRLTLNWTETGGPVVREPTRQGFGTRLIKRLAKQLNANLQCNHNPRGIVYEFDMPLNSILDS